MFLPYLLRFSRCPQYTLSLCYFRSTKSWNIAYKFLFKRIDRPICHKRIKANLKNKIPPVDYSAQEKTETILNYAKNGSIRSIQRLFRITYIKTLQSANIFSHWYRVFLHNGSVKNQLAVRQRPLREVAQRIMMHIILNQNFFECCRIRYWDFSLVYTTYFTKILHMIT